MRIGRASGSCDDTNLVATLRGDSAKALTGLLGDSLAPRRRDLEVTGNPLELGRCAVTELAQRPSRIDGHPTGLVDRLRRQDGYIGVYGLNLVFCLAAAPTKVGPNGTGPGLHHSRPVTGLGRRGQAFGLERPY